MAAAAGIRGIHETALYAGDVDAAAAFYTDVLRIPVFERYAGLAAVFRLEDGGIFLIFDPERSSAPGRTLPAHGANGPGHVAFSVAPGSLDAFVEAFGERGIEIEVDVTLDLGGRSIYVRDPAGNSVELVDGTIWPDVPRT